MNKAVCILGIVVMVAKGTLTPSVSVRCRNPQPDFKETVSVNGTTIWPSRRIGLFSRFKICRVNSHRGSIPLSGTICTRRQTGCVITLSRWRRGFKPLRVPQGECCFSASFNDLANGKKKWFWWLSLKSSVQKSTVKWPQSPVSVKAGWLS